MRSRLVTLPLPPDDVGQHDDRLSRRLAVSAREQPVARLDELLLAFLNADVTRPPEAEEKIGIVGIARLGNRQCVAEVFLRLRQCVQRQRSITRFAQCPAHPASDRAHVLARRTRKLEGVDVVVRDHLGLILGPAERLDPLRRP